MTLGDMVIITTETGRQIQGKVVMVNGTGRAALMLECDAMIGGWAGTIPVIQDVAGQYTTLNGVPLQLEVGELEDD